MLGKKIQEKMSCIRFVCDIWSPTLSLSEQLIFEYLQEREQENMNESISVVSELSDRWIEFLVTPSGWKVYLCDLFSGRWNITLGGVLWLSKHGNDSSAVSPWDTPFFQSDRWCFWDVRESWFPPAALNMCMPDFLLAVLNLSTLPVCCWRGKKWKYRVCI